MGPARRRCPSGNLTGPGVRLGAVGTGLRRGGSSAVPLAAGGGGDRTWREPAAGRRKGAAPSCRGRSGRRGSGRAGRGGSPEAAGEALRRRCAPEARSDESAGQGKLRPPPAAHPSARAAGARASGLAASGPADGLPAARGPGRDWKFWRLGEGGRPQPLRTLGTRGAETLVLALSPKASEPQPGSHLATLEGRALCVNAWRSWGALHFPCFGTAWFRALSAEPEHLSELTRSTTDYDPEQVT